MGSAWDVHYQLTMKELSQARRCGMIGKKEYSVQVEETGLASQNTADQKQIKSLDITGVRALINTKPISFLLMLLLFFYVLLSALLAHSHLPECVVKAFYTSHKLGLLDCNTNRTDFNVIIMVIRQNGAHFGL